jgi:CPA2 family monovalent cation:H+ antiporter-2
VAGLAVASEIEPDLGPLAVGYVFLLAVVGPIAARLSEPIADRFLKAPDLGTPQTTDEPA